MQATGDHFVKKQLVVSSPKHAQDTQRPAMEQALIAHSWSSLPLQAGSLPSAVGELIPFLGSIDVALRPRGPEDWTDIFNSSLGVSADSPGQRPPAWEEQVLTQFLC